MPAASPHAYRVSGIFVEESEALVLAVRVLDIPLVHGEHATVKAYIPGNLTNSISFEFLIATSHYPEFECAVHQRPGRLKLLRARSTLLLITQSAT